MASASLKMGSADKLTKIMSVSAVIRATFFKETGALLILKFKLSRIFCALNGTGTTKFVFLVLKEPERMQMVFVCP